MRYKIIMIKVDIISVGKLKENFFVEANKEYLQRVR